MIRRLFVVVNMKVIVTMTTVCLCHFNLLQGDCRCRFHKKWASRDRLKPYLEELLTCLDRVDDVTQIEKFSKLVEVEVGRLRCIIAQSTQKH
jgi:hypothetical protein